MTHARSNPGCWPAAFSGEACAQCCLFIVNLFPTLPTHMNAATVFSVDTLHGGQDAGPYL